MDNAFKWTRSRIMVEARVDGDRAVIEIHDDGPGVSPDEVDAILQPAYRIDTSTSGSGLGLAITNDLVRAYGGELEIGRSEMLGGLMVRMRLRRVSQVRGAPAVRRGGLSHGSARALSQTLAIFDRPCWERSDRGFRIIGRFCG